MEAQAGVLADEKPIGDLHGPVRRFARRIGFLLLNVWIGFHLLAVFLPGAAMAPSSELARTSYFAVSGYLQAIFMDHGYHFFGPDPGSSTLLGFVAKTSNGEQRRGFYPHKGIYPRLLYHRHFMLTEAIPQIATGDQNLYQKMVRAYAARVGRSFSR